MGNFGAILIELFVILVFVILVKISLRRLSMNKCPNCNSTNVHTSSYKEWFKCEDCLFIFD